MEATAKSSSVTRTREFFEHLGISEKIPEATETKHYYSQLIRNLLTVDGIDPGHVVCSLSVNCAITNPYNTLHGGVVAAVAEMVGLACAKTVAGDKEFFLGESSTAYLAAARLNDDVEVDGSVLRQGRNVIVTSVEFRGKKNQKKLYTSRSTFYVMPAASL